MQHQQHMVHVIDHDQPALDDDAHPICLCYCPSTGQQLAQEVLRRLGPNPSPPPVVLALPRGGVPVADEVAKALMAPLDVIIVRKIGAPIHPEVGLLILKSPSWLNRL